MLDPVQAALWLPGGESAVLIGVEVSRGTLQGVLPPSYGILNERTFWGIAPLLAAGSFPFSNAIVIAIFTDQHSGLASSSRDRPGAY